MGVDRRNQSKLLGATYEQRFVYESMLRGLYAHSPPADMPCHDFIVLNQHNTCLLTQVRSSNSMHTRGTGKSARFKVQTRCEAKRSSLKDAGVDVLSIFVVPYETWYHIPTGDLTATCVNLMPHIIGSKGTWEKYKGAWGIFDRKS